jgi:hypothetical protein
MILWKNATGSGNSAVAHLLAPGPIAIKWYGMTTGSFMPQWSQNYNPRTGVGDWNDYLSGSRTTATGEINQDNEGGCFFRLDATSITGGIYARIDGPWVDEV